MSSTVFQIVSPCNYAELAYWLERLLLEDGPRALRYPRGAEDEALAALDCSGLEYDVFRAEGPADAALVTYGAQAKEALAAAKLAAQQGVCVDVYKLTVIHPLPQGFVMRSAVTAASCLQRRACGAAVSVSIWRPRCWSAAATRLIGISPCRTTG